MSNQEYLAAAVPVIRKVLPHDAWESSSDQELLDKRLDDIVMDSLTRMELVLKLEESFGVLVNETKLAECETLRAVVDVIYHSEKST